MHQNLRQKTFLYSPKKVMERSGRNQMWEKEKQKEKVCDSFFPCQAWHVLKHFCGPVDACSLDTSISGVRCWPLVSRQYPFSPHDIISRQKWHRGYLIELIHSVQSLPDILMKPYWMFETNSFWAACESLMEAGWLFAYLAILLFWLASCSTGIE